MPRLLFIGDIVGRPGRNIVRDLLPGFVASEQIDFVDETLNILRVRQDIKIDVDGAVTRDE